MPEILRRILGDDGMRETYSTFFFLNFRCRLDADAADAADAGGGTTTASTVVCFHCYYCYYQSSAASRFTLHASPPSPPWSFVVVRNTHYIYISH
mmetsp:Transcript_52490/g.127091  ORF Transcript_52490/g.127091 Transcript_52490/m.127091 type:complete len:95 (+) Transcript_52490:468-752(+)